MKVVYTYARGGFFVNLALMVMKFEKISDKMALVEVDITATREHIPTIEYQIRTVKEHTRCATCDFPFDPIPKMVIIHLVYTICMWLNVSLLKLGVTGGLSPCELVTGRKVNYRRDCRDNFRAYLQASTDVVITNDWTPHSNCCISLVPSRNHQNLLKYFDLETGKVVLGRTFKHIPWPDRMIKKTRWWGCKNKSLMVKGNIKFLNRRVKSLTGTTKNYPNLKLRRINLRRITLI